MRFVEMTHPKAGRATVPESAVPHHIRAGWMPVEDKQQDPPESNDAADQDDGDK